jgi:hypothetical protein
VHADWGVGGGVRPHRRGFRRETYVVLCGESVVFLTPPQRSRHQTRRTEMELPNLVLLACVSGNVGGEREQTHLTISRFSACIAVITMPTMTERLVSDICVKKGYFRTPELNDRLYLHFLGFRKIENLEKFVACTALWLDNNWIEELENLEALIDLRALYLQNNTLRTLGSVRLSVLDTLNVECNAVDDLSGLCHMPLLKKFHASKNKIDDSQLHHLLQCPGLVFIDVSHNRISGEPSPDALFDALPKLPELASIKLEGNGIVRRIPNYRKKLISTLKALRHLDDYPVFDEERRTAEAFSVGGIEAERAERAAIRREEEQRQKDQRAFFESFLEEAKRKPKIERLQYELDQEAEAKRQELAERNVPVAVGDSKGLVRPRGNAVLDSHQQAASEDEGSDDDDVFIPQASPATSASRPHHADPFAQLSPNTGEGNVLIVDPKGSTLLVAPSSSAVAASEDVSDGATPKEGTRPDGVDLTEEAVCERLKLGDDVIASIRSLFSSPRP